MRVALLVLVVASAGCMSATPESRSDSLFINITAEGEWSVAVPLPADTLSKRDLWGALRISAAAGEARLDWQDTDLPLTIHGNGSLSVEGLQRWDQPGCCLFEVNQGIWTHADLDDGPMLVDVLQGNISQLRIEHSVVACRGEGCDDLEGPVVQCSVENKGWASAMSPGLQALERRPPLRTCLE